ncbi:MAG: hypothetical protein JO044_00145 [Mycobacteriaceae bacterium]|nr:hypothetical protein [Mycobacteriaceae bacterium]MBV9640826.1 hypothetical protein [Mycobacteriaceae bacterium]
MTDDEWLASVDADGPVDLDRTTLRPTSLESNTATAPEAKPPAAAPPALSKTVAIGLAALVATVTIAVTVAMLAMRSGPPVTTSRLQTAAQVSVVTAAALPTDPGGPPLDTPIPYTASASCPPGSTAAQALSGSDPTRAFVCVRNGVDGQVITLDLGRAVSVTAISIVPGWVGTDGGGHDQWLAHRVVAKAQYIFDDATATVVTQDTGSVHGEAVVPVPFSERSDGRGVLGERSDGRGSGVVASKITMIVLQTSRPPADPAPPSEPSTLPLPEITLPTTTEAQDPADATFAIGALRVLGHDPH